MLQLPQNALVVTADGHRAILLRNQGAEGALELRLDHVAYWNAPLTHARSGR